MKKLLEILTTMHVAFDFLQTDATYADGGPDEPDPPALVVHQGRPGVTS